MKYFVHAHDTAREVELAPVPGRTGFFRVTLGGAGGDRTIEAEARRAPDGGWLLILDGRSVAVHVARARGAAAATVCLDGQAIELQCRTAMEETLASSGGAGASADLETHVRTSMPGKVVDVKVAPGDVVEPGQRLIVLEAMKMENEIQARGPGRVKVVHVAKGQAVDSGALLVELEAVG